MTRKGLLVELMGRDCTNGGVTSGKKQAILAGDGVAEIFEASDDTPLLILGKRCGLLIAVPAEQPTGMCGPMFGGRFIYTSDSRFPNPYPIPVHDRFETQEEADRLSR